VQSKENGIKSRRAAEALRKDEENGFLSMRTAIPAKLDCFSATREVGQEARCNPLACGSSELSAGAE